MRPTAKGFPTAFPWTCRAALLLGALASPVWMYAQDRVLHFDVASVRLSDAGSSEKGGAHITPVGIIMRNVSIGELIKESFQIRSDVFAGPSWLNDVRLDIDAKTSAPATPKELQTMLQALLRDRMQLAFHIENKEKSVYMLSAGPEAAQRLRTSAAPPARNPDAYCDETRVNDDDRTFRHVACKKVSMAQFANSMGKQELLIDRPLIDRTGIEGDWSFTFDWRQDREAVAGGLADAVRSLGLEIRNSKAPVQVLVVDRCNRTPTPN